MTSFRAVRTAACAAVLLAVLTAACKRERTSVAVDAGLLTLVPEDTVMISAIRVKALRSTISWKKLLEQKAVNEYFDKLAAETSFDVRKDLWEVVFSSNGKENLVLARGEFAPMGIEPKIPREDVRRMAYKGSMLLGNDEAAVWFVNSSTAVFGRTPMLHSLIDSRDTRKGGPGAELRSRLDLLPPSAHIWMVADAARLPKLKPGESKEGSPAANLFQNLPRLLQSVRYMSMFADMTDGVAVTAAASCTDETGARQVHDSARGIIGIARFSLPAPLRPDLMPVLDAVAVEQKQTETTVKARLTSEQIEKIHHLLGSFSQPGARKAD